MAQDTQAKAAAFSQTVRVTDSFDVSQYQYPQNIGGSEESRYMVMFFINVPSNASIIKNNRVEAYEYQDATNRQSVKNAATIDAGVKGITTVVATGAGAGAGAVVGGVAGKTATGTKGGTVAGAIAGGAVGAKAGAEVADQINSNIIINNKAKKLKTAIALYMPPDLRFNYGINWAETGLEAGIVSSVLNNASNAKNLADGVAGFGKDMVKLAANQGVSRVLQSVGIDKNMVNAVRKEVINPNREQAFESVNFRDFTFNFTFTPKDAQEALYVKNIINMFKYHMHPEISNANGSDSTGQYLIFPSEFDIKFYVDGSENQWIPKISTCALADMSVDMAPNGMFTAFKNMGGAPSQINMQLRFKELEPITRDVLTRFNEDPYNGSPV